MLAAAAVMLFFGMSSTRSLAEMLYERLEKPSVQLLPGDAVHQLRAFLEFSAPVVLPIMASMVFAGLALNLMQFGFLISWESLQPNWARINPLAGVGRLFSVQSVMRLGVSLGKLTIVVVIAVLFVSRTMPHTLEILEVDWQTTAEDDPNEDFRERAIAPPLMSFLWSSVIRLAFEMAAALIILGIIDYAFQRWKLTRDLRMTKQEVRDELKNFEGDPATRMHAGRRTANSPKPANSARFRMRM